MIRSFINSFYLFIFFLILFLILNILDGHSTYLVVSKTSLKSEKNPIARWIFKKLGLLKGIFFLKFISLVLTILIFLNYKLIKDEINIILAAGNLFYLFVVINNYRNYKKYQKFIKKFEIR